MLGFSEEIILVPRHMPNQSQVEGSFRLGDATVAGTLSAFVRTPENKDRKQEIAGGEAAS